MRGTTSKRIVYLTKSSGFAAVFLAASMAAADIGVAPGQGVSLSQEVYYDDISGNAAVTTVFGTISVDVATLAASTGQASGYINVGDGGDWVVQNLPVSAAMGNLSTSFVFNQFSASNPANGGVQQPATTLTSNNLAIDYTSDPLPQYYPPGQPPPPYIPPGGSQYPSYPPPYPYPVRPDGMQYCGLIPAPNNFPPPGPNNNPPNNQILSAAALNGAALNLPALPLVKEAVPNLNAADQQCVPAAFANDLLYMSAKYNVALPAADLGIPGRYGKTSPVNAVLNYFVPTGVNQEGPPFVQTEAAGITLVGKLDNAMNRGNAARSPNAAGNSGVSIAPELSGLTSYMAGANLAGTFGILTQGVPLNTAFNNNGVSVTLNNTPPTFQFIYNSLLAGDSVEGSYFYGGTDGHAIDIIGAGTLPLVGLPYIAYESDWVQTGNLDPLDAVLAPPGASDIHYSLIVPTKGAVVGSDGLWLPGEGTVGGVMPVLTDLTVIYFIPEPSVGALGMLSLALVALRRRRD